MTSVPYWNKAIETLPVAELRSLQLSRLRLSVDRALKTPFYHRLLRQAGLNAGSDIRSLDDLTKLPFTTKDDLRNAYPYGLLSVPCHDVVRLHASSGTTGTPTVIYHTRSDIANWTELTARSIVSTGAGPNDVFQNMMTYGLFTGGLGLHYGAETVGLLVIPASSGNTMKQIKLLKDFDVTVVHATPSYLLHLYSKLVEEGIDPRRLTLKKAFVGAEPHSEQIRKKIEELYDMDVYNSYGLSEMNGPGVAFESVHKADMHVWEDQYIVEAIDPKTGVPVAEGEEGELVFTTLMREATPLIRYRTRDLSTILPVDPATGRTHRRITRIVGRSDDMLIINGVNVFPSQIEEVIMNMAEVGTNYQIVITKDSSLDRLVVKTEVNEGIFSDDTRDLNRLRTRIRERLRASISISATVELHEPGVLPVSEGKAVRVIDMRGGE